MKKKDSIGIFGGTFNPIHNFHLKMARAAQKRFGLKKIIFVPSGNPPHKKIKNKISAAERYQMTLLAVKPFSAFTSSRIELKHPGKSYSIETVKRLKKRFGKDADFFFIIGSDSLSELFTWKSSGKLLTLCKFIVFPRHNFPVKIKDRYLLDKVKLLPLTAQKISSTKIRTRIRRGQSVSDLVPESVIRYIQKKGLYGAKATEKDKKDKGKRKQKTN